MEKEVLEIIESYGFEIIAEKRVRLTKREVDIVWETCLFEDFYEGLLEFSLSGDCVVFIVRGDDAITSLNNLVGHREPMKAKSHTIRHRFGISNRRNLIHSTEDEGTFWKEVSLFFTQSELFTCMVPEPILDIQKSYPES